MYLAFFEVVAIVWIYGADRLARNVQEMTGRMPSLYFRFCWYLAAPLLILVRLYSHHVLSFFIMMTQIYCFIIITASDEALLLLYVCH